MERSKRNRKENKKVMIIAAVVLVVAVALCFGFFFWKQNVKKEAKIKQGVAYLESLEKQDVKAIGEKIDAIKAEQSLALAENDENAVWMGFDDALILGDSRSVGFRFYEFLLDHQVIAEKGRKITDVMGDIERIKSIQPKQIFLAMGLNDIKSEIWPDPVEYAKAYEQVIQKLQKELPDSSIYVNSILPAIGDGYASYSGYARIGEYNAALKEMAEKNGCHYIDNDAMAVEHADLYEPDGLHLQKAFYKYWAASMLNEVRNQ